MINHYVMDMIIRLSLSQFTVCGAPRLDLNELKKENVMFVYTEHRFIGLPSRYTDHQHSRDASRLSHGKQCGRVTCGEVTNRSINYFTEIIIYRN